MKKTALTLALLLLPAAANAQFAGPLSPGAFESTLNMGPIANALRDTDTAPPRTAPTSPAVEAARLRYVPDKARRKAYLDGFVAKARKQDAAGGEQLAKLFAQGDIIEQIGTGLRPFGVRIDDVADVYSIWSISLWQASRGDMSTPSRETVAAVRRQSALAIANTGILRSASDAVKQELAESMLVQTMLTDSGMEQAKADPSQLPRMRAAALSSARSMGLDLSNMTLTPQGFAGR